MKAHPHASERRKELLRLLEESPVGYTAPLAEKLGVSVMTVRRDFEALAKQGLVTLVRGGAARNHGSATLYSLGLRQTKLPLEKERIGRFCASLVTEGATVFLDCGSTVQRIAQALRGHHLVLTNALDAANILAEKDDVQTIMVPGVFEPAMRGYFGPMTIDFMDRFEVDFLFLGANGIDAAYGLTSPNYVDAETKRALIRRAKRVIVAADHTKLGQHDFERIARLETLSHIVTDRGANPADIVAIEACGCALSCV